MQITDDGVQLPFLGLIFEFDTQQVFTALHGVATVAFRKFKAGPTVFIVKFPIGASRFGILLCLSKVRG
jgi:hypothetical protein